MTAPRRRRKSARMAAPKPKKPYAGFPLTAHPCGQWCKKIRGKLHYFGKWDDWRAALASYEAGASDLRAGRERRPDPAAVTVADVVNQFLNERRGRVESGELSPRTHDQYARTGRLVAAHLGRAARVAELGPPEFAALRTALGQGRGHVTTGIHVRNARIMFRFAHEHGLVDRPVRTGTRFKPPSRKAVRRERRERGRRDFAPEECRALLAAAADPLRAMILLGLNCGFGNTDCAELRRSAVDFEAGLLDDPRPKTQADRRAALWPETVAAVRAATGTRPAARSADDADLVFLTRKGRRFVRCELRGDGRTSTTDAVGQAFRRAADAAGLEPGRGFYCLRRTFRTLADETGDAVAAGLVMGHTDESMAGLYRQRVGDDRLVRVAAHVRRRVLGETAPPWPEAAGEDG